MEDKIKKAAELIKDSNYIVAFTGAGISTESGIPDFRSPGGLWERYDPSIYAEISSFLSHPEKYWKMHRELSQMVLNAEPNPAHVALADLEHKYGKLKTVITQNVDFLHSRAGNTNVLEIHGSGQTARCLKCNKEFHYTQIQQMLEEEQYVPRCPHPCYGLIKTNTILFGEQLPWDVLDQAREEILAADLLIIIGSSLLVYPAAALPSLAQQSGTRLIIINMEPTMMDSYANVVLHSKAGKILPKVFEAFESLINDS
ncbi:MAG: NAD-dependent deacylase [Candidatus Heimdallarchaeota archaeon]|nr:MAG: NAD-dependent deacylase [Candidatus Heimdallarchaeota archaeon]